MLLLNKRLERMAVGGGSINKTLVNNMLKTHREIGHEHRKNREFTLNPNVAP